MIKTPSIIIHLTILLFSRGKYSNFLALLSIDYQAFSNSPKILADELRTATLEHAVSNYFMMQRRFYFLFQHHISTSVFFISCPCLSKSSSFVYCTLGLANRGLDFWLFCVQGLDFVSNIHPLGLKKTGLGLISVIL